MQVPTIHLNGTSAKELVEQLINVANPLRDAIKAHAVALPNGRDYYPQGNDAIGKATTEWCHRHDNLVTALRELEDLASAIQEVNDGKVS